LAGKIAPFLHLFDERLGNGDGWRRRLGLGLGRALPEAPVPIEQRRYGNGEKEKDDPAHSPAPARRCGFGRRRRGARRGLILARDGVAVPISLVIHDRISFSVAALDPWRLPSGRPGETLQKGGGEGETEWPHASRNRQRPGLQSLSPAAFPARLALASNASHFRAFRTSRP